MNARTGFLERVALPSLQGLPVQVPMADKAPVHVEGFARPFSPALTFTPFASVRPCSGRCIFCSETLQHRQQKRMSASLRPGPRYFHQLQCALHDLRILPMGLSLSGLEQTDDADFFEGIMDSIVAHRQSGGCIRDVVLYSNGAGLARSTTGARLVPRLAEVTRVELSRHSNLQSRNDAIMRFRPEVSVAKQAAFEEVVRDAHAFAHVRLVCVVQHGGVDDARTLMSYLRWAANLGVKDVVFRELSRLGDTYRANRTLRLVEERRVGIEGLFEGVHQELELHHVVDGYYYWNVACAFEDMRVTFEVADYIQMKKEHASDVVQKLVFHADGTLGADWDPDREVLKRYA
ncbi:MAG: hypothetical protein AB8H86_16890 [Polyangiales bacterium]